MAERRWLREAVRHAILVAAVVAMGLPFVEMLAVSLAAPSTVFSGELLPAPDWRAAVANYGVALTGVPLLRYMGNGVVVCAAILVLQVLIAAPAGYALAKLRFGLRPVLFVAVIVGLLVPMQIPAIPLYLAIARAGLLDSYTALVLPFIVSVFAMFLFRQFFMTYPDEIVDAARLDGFSELSIVWRLMLPAAKPAVAAFACVSVIAHWNDLYWPLVVITRQDMMTPALGIAAFSASGDSTGNPGALMAAGVLVTAPLVLGFIRLQRHLIHGFGLGGR